MAIVLRGGVKDAEFAIYHGDTLTDDWDLLRETNPAKKPTFDTVVAIGSPHRPRSSGRGRPAFFRDNRSLIRYTAAAFPSRGGK